MPALPPLLPDRARRDWTVDQLQALPDDGNRYEVVDGELLVTPSPSWLHQRAAFELGVLLKSFAEANGLEILLAPASVTFAPNRSVEPDLFVVPHLMGRAAARFEDVRQLVLAVEVLSPSSSRADRHIKRRLYLREGAREYWVVEPEARLVERWRPLDSEPDVLVESLTWTPHDGGEPLVIDLEAYFRRVHREGTGTV